MQNSLAPNAAIDLLTSVQVSVLVPSVTINLFVDLCDTICDSVVISPPAANLTAVT